MRQSLMGHPTSFSLKNGFLSIQDKDFHFVFPLSQRNIDSYGKGIDHIIEKIGVAYHLDSIKLFPGDLVVDCGANVGALYLYLKKWYGNLVYYQGFEPGALEFLCLQQNVEIKNLVHQTALNEVDGGVAFFYSPDGADSSLIEPPNFINKYVANGARIDTIFSGSIKLLKIDAEGAELEVLKGAQNLLEKIKYITVDLGFERGRSQDSTLIEVFNFLIPEGFCPIKINRRMVVLFENNSI